MSHRSTALDWITDKQAGEFFQPADVPGTSSTVSSLLTDLLKEPLPIIGRACHNLYYREPPPVDEYYGETPGSFSHAALAAYTPAGSGLADICALDALGWTTQCAAVTRVAVSRRGLKVPTLTGFPRLSYHYRPNPRRGDLTWPEVTLLEAARTQDNRDRPLKRILENLSLFLPGNQHGQSVRSDGLAWAAETEQVSTPKHFDDPHLYQNKFNETISPVVDTLVKLGY